MLATFLQEYIWTLGVLIGFGLAGSFVILPFRKSVRYLTFISPLAGLLIGVILTSAIYNVLAISVWTSMILAGAFCFAASISTILYQRHTLLKPDISLLVYAALLIAFITYITNYTTIQFGVPGFLYMDGSDHLGYAHLADWLNNHSVMQPPVLSADAPYQSWPFYAVLQEANRFGSYFSLAVLSNLHNHSGMFGYDGACGVILSAGILAVSGTFARSRGTFFLLSLGLVTSLWYDYSRSGYLGKLLNYPSTLMCVGLFMLTFGSFDVLTVVMLTALTAAATSMHSLQASELLFVFIGGMFVFLTIISAATKNEHFSLPSLATNIVVLIFLIAVMNTTTGFLIHPVMPLSLPVLEMPLRQLLPQVVDLGRNSSHYNALRTHTMFNNFIFFSCIAIITLIIGMLKRTKITTALIAGPMIIFIFLVAKGLVWPLYQLSGTFYPWFLCAAIYLLDSLYISRDIRGNKLLLGCIALLVLIAMALHIPRFVGALNLYSGNEVIKTLQFTQPQMDQLATLMNGKEVLIDITSNSNVALPTLVEFGRRNISMQWSPKSWQLLVGYRGWTMPTTSKKEDLRLEDKSAAIDANCLVKLETNQYQLVECSH